MIHNASITRSTFPSRHTQDVPEPHGEFPSFEASIKAHADPGRRDRMTLGESQLFASDAQCFGEFFS